MDDRRARFLAQLRETFRAEAAEHIESMSAALVALERAVDAERAPLVEQVFREAHSLKGASRAVGFTRAEATCLELESLFAAARNDGLHLTSEHLDGAHGALARLAVLCADPSGGEPETPAANPDRTPAGAPGRGPGHRAAAVDQVPAAGVTPAPAPAPTGGSAPASTPPITPAPVPAHASAPGPAPVPDAGPVVGDLPRVAPAERAGSPSATPGSGTTAEVRTRSAAPASDTVRVAVPRLTGLMRDSEALAAATSNATALAARLARLADDVAAASGGAPAVGALGSEHLRTLRDLAATAARDAKSLATTTDLVVNGARSTLLLPFSALLGSFGAIARDIARQHGKDVELRVEGEDLEVDRRILDELRDPLNHLVRNAIDHGVESPEVRRAAGKPERATITIAVAAAPDSRVRLAVGDDGAGLDTERVAAAAARMGLPTGPDAALDAGALIFESGLSSSPMVTDLSGRGLGLAIVREKVHKLNGSISVTSQAGVGTTFHLEVPVSLANFRGVAVGVSGRTVIIPSAAITRVRRVPAAGIVVVDGRPTVQLDGGTILLAPLHELLELPAPDQRSLPAVRSVVGIAAAERRVALLVDEVHGEQDVILKHLGPLLERVPAVAGVSMGAHGQVVPVLDATDLVERAVSGRAGAAHPAIAARDADRVLRLLVADDSITSRSLLRSLFTGEGYAVTTAVDGEEALSRLHTEPFDILVSDVDMPRLTGFELTAAVRADSALASLPVVLVTSLATPEDRARGLAAGASAYVVKSNFDSGNLLDIVRRFV